MGSVLRFLQAGELCLDEALQGIPGEIPPYLHSSIVNARYIAAQNLFATAIRERVDLLIIAGSICSPYQDSRTFWFLQQQFELLNSHGIQVLCIDPTLQFPWPSTISLPENVSILTQKQAGKTLAAQNSKLLSVHWSKNSANTTSDSKIHCELRLTESMGRVTRVGYRTDPSKSFTQISSKPTQRQSFEEYSSPAASLIQASSVDGISYSESNCEAVGFSEINIDLTEQLALNSLRNELREQFRLAEQSRESHHRPLLVSISLILKGSATFPDSHQEQNSILNFLQEDARARESHFWPVQINIKEHSSRQRFTATETPVQIAMNELETLALEDVYENLDIQVLDIDEHALQRLKDHVALRLPELLSESRQNSA